MIILKEAWELDIMRSAGGKLAEVFHYISPLIVPGITTKEIDALVEDKIISIGAKAILKGYKVGDLEFPCATCISINEEVVHGIPSQRVILEEDIVSLDISLSYLGYHSDMAKTFAMPMATDASRFLIQKTEDCLSEGIVHAKVGNRIGTIGNSIEVMANKSGFDVVRSFVGHGIGKLLHESPSVPNFGKANTGPMLKSGMVFAIEPMLTIMSGEVEVLEDLWTASTIDGGLSAHFEHTVAITESGPKILTI